MKPTNIKMYHTWVKKKCSSELLNAFCKFLCEDYTILQYILFRIH